MPGFAFEAAAACRDYVFSTLGRERVISLVRPENLPSAAIARKLEMQTEKDIFASRAEAHGVRYDAARLNAAGQE